MMPEAGNGLAGAQALHTQSAAEWTLQLCGETQPLDDCLRDFVGRMRVVMSLMFPLQHHYDDFD